MFTLDITNPENKPAILVSFKSIFQSKYESKNFLKNEFNKTQFFLQALYLNEIKTVLGFKTFQKQLLLSKLIIIHSYNIIDTNQPVDLILFACKDDNFLTELKKELP